MTDAPRLVDTAAAAVAVRRPQGTIRRWGSEGVLVRRGRDRRGRALYDLRDVYRVAHERREVSSG